MHYEEVELNIRLAVNPSGDLASLRQREQAALFLLNHADIAYPRLINLVQQRPSSWAAARLVELIGFFKREDSVPLLKHILLQGIPETSRTAGRAIGTIKNTTAYQALKEGLALQTVEVRISALEGIRLSRDKSWCFDIEPSLIDQNANLRYYAVNTAAELGCLDRERLESIAEYDTDDNVRQLCIEWLKRL